MGLPQKGISGYFGREGVWGLHVAFKENNGLPSAAILHCFGPHDGFVTVATSCWPMQRSQLVSKKQIHTLPPFLPGNSSIDLPTVQNNSAANFLLCAQQQRFNLQPTLEGFKRQTR